MLPVSIPLLDRRERLRTLVEAGQQALAAVLLLTAVARRLSALAHPMERLTALVSLALGLAHGPFTAWRGRRHRLELSADG